MLMVNSFAFQQQRGASALATAIAFLPMPLTYLASIPLVNVLAHWRGPRLPMTAGLVLMAAGMLLYSAVGPQAGQWMLEASFVLTGAGLALNTGPAVGLAMAAVPVQRAGLASGVVNLARLFGITVGIAVLGTVLAAVSGGATNGVAFDNGVRITILVGAIVELVGAVVVFGWGRSKQPAASESTSNPREASHA
jgi:MFS family permease